VTSSRAAVTRSVGATLGALALVSMPAGALAAGKVGPGDIANDAVRSKHVKNGQVRTPDLAKGAVKGAQLGNNAVGGAKVAGDALTGADIDELALDLAILQHRLVGSCGAGEAIRAVAQDGVLTCEAVGGGGQPSGPAGGDLAGSYPNPTIGAPLDLTAGTGGTPTLSGANTAEFGTGILGSGYWGLFGTSTSGSNGATGVAALAEGTGGNGLTALATGAGGTALAASAAGAATQAADLDGTVAIDAGASDGQDPALQVQASTTPGESDGVAGDFDGRVVMEGQVNESDEALLDVSMPIGSGNGINARGRVGVRGVGTTIGIGVLGETVNGVGTGVTGVADGGAASEGLGVRAVAQGANDLALEARANFPATDAADFIGDVFIAGDLAVTGTVSKGGGTFKIDHPLDPAGRYLSHSFVESPEMKNVYDGVVTTGADGFASVRMPSWFDALNRDYRYQLTVLGRSFARAIVWREMRGNSFRIRTSRPATKVSWQVTGIRDDPYARAHPIRVSERKRGDERGAYLHPEAAAGGGSKPRW